MDLHPHTSVQGERQSVELNRASLSGLSPSKRKSFSANPYTLSSTSHLAGTGSDAHQTRHCGKPWLVGIVHILGLATLPLKRNDCFLFCFVLKCLLKHLCFVETLDEKQIPKKPYADNPEETKSCLSQPPPFSVCDNQIPEVLIKSRGTIFYVNGKYDWRLRIL